MSRNRRQRITKIIIRIAKKLSNLSRKIGVSNIFQLGLIKEIIIADILGHAVIPPKEVLMLCV